MKRLLNENIYKGANISNLCSCNLQVMSSKSFDVNSAFSFIYIINLSLILILG